MGLLCRAPPLLPGPTADMVGCAAQIGFVVAFLAEFNVPREGLFGAWDGHSLSVFGASASFLIACAAVSRPLQCMPRPLQCCAR